MFEDSLFATNAKPAPRRGLATMISFALQAVILSVLVLVPLIYTDAVPLGNLKTYFEIAPPPGRAPAPTQPPRHAARPIQSNMENGRVIAPIVIPPNIAHPVDPPDSGQSERAGNFTDGVVGGTGDDSAAFRTILPSAAHSVVIPVVQPPRVVRLSTGVTEGLLIRRIMPVYPSIAKQVHVQGAVVLLATISKDGMVEHLQTVSGHPYLVPAAVDAVRQWRYRPYLLNNEPVEIETQITVNFTLN